MEVPPLPHPLPRRGEGSPRTPPCSSLSATSASPREIPPDAMRAAENRRWLIRCSNTGPSVIIDERGSIRNWLRGENGALFDVSGWMVGDVELESRTTFYSRHGDCVSPVAWLVLAALLLLPAPAIVAWASCP